MKNLKFLFTTLLLLCSVVVTAHDFEVGGIFYKITDNANKTVEVTYKGSSFYEYSNEYAGVVIIPESVTYSSKTYSVTSIGESAFYKCSGLTSVTIPNSVTSIGNDAFYGCFGLKEVHINDLIAWCSINIVGDYANPLSYAHNLYLNNELITELVIPNSVTSIAYQAFKGCSGLTSVTIPNSVTSIGNYAFAYCDALTSVTIGNSVTSIGNYAFSGCSGLTSVTIGNSVTSIGSSAFYGCSALTSITIPNSVTSIGGSAFKDCI